jgi:murein hydrolase activator
MIRILAFLCLLFNLPPLHLHAAEAEGNLPTSIIRIGKLQQEIFSHQDKIEQTGREEHSLLDELAVLDSTIDKQKAKIDVLQRRLQEQEQVIEAKEKELATISRKNEALRQHLINRLRSFYLIGKTGVLNIVFSNKTLPDLLLANDAFHSLVTYDQELFAEYRKSVLDIDRAKRAYELEKSVQEHFLADAGKETSLLQQIADEKNTVLKRIQTEKGLYEQALKEMKKAENDLLSALNKPSGRPEQQTRGFAAQKRKLPPPVWGKVANRFLEPAASGESSPFANGITIVTADRADVFAVYGGVVIFAGYMSGYGKIVIIEHDQNYFTVTAQFDEIRIREGDVVRQGQIIGTTGDLATLLGKGLYFEIRRGAQPENPLDWIQPKTLAGQ